LIYEIPRFKLLVVDIKKSRINKKVKQRYNAIIQVSLPSTTGP